MLMWRFFLQVLNKDKYVITLRIKNGGRKQMLHQNNMAKISFKLKILLSFLIFTGLFTQLLQHDENNFNNFTSTSWDAIVPYDAQGFVTHVRLIGNTEVDSYFSAQSGDGLTAQTAYTFGPDTRNFNYNIYFQIEMLPDFLISLI